MLEKYLQREKFAITSERKERFAKGEGEKKPSLKRANSTRKKLIRCIDIVTYTRRRVYRWQKYCTQNESDIPAER